jgi:purine-binding chemotaxis protein CheW
MNQNKQSAKLRSSKNKFLTYFLNDEQYGIEISQVREIIAMMKITPVPRTPRYISGVINLRGSIIPVVDTRKRFEMEEIEYTEQTAIIIIEIKKMSIGFIVDMVEEVLAIEDENISEPPKFGTNVNMEFIKNMARHNDAVVMIMDMEKLFESEELNMLESITK